MKECENAERSILRLHTFTNYQFQCNFRDEAFKLTKSKVENLRTNNITAYRTPLSKIGSTK